MMKNKHWNDSLDRPLDNWIKGKIGLIQDADLTREELEKYQLEKITATLRMAKENSAFYKEHLKAIDPDAIKDLKDIGKIPFMTEKDLRNRGNEMLCVRNAQISRIVTLETSGTTANPKRVFYTKEDQELTIDYFHHGMKNLVDARDVVLILMPCARPGSVGDLLDIGLQRLGAKTLPYGLLKSEYQDVPAVLKQMEKEGVTSIVGTPTQVAELARISSELTKAFDGLTSQRKWQSIVSTIVSQMRSVLLSAEYVSKEACDLINHAWNCQVFEHYGMTEMGLGGAVSCWALEGYHPREADLYFEIIDSKTSEVLPDGEFGEVVFTTLTRKGMPFIRYRTGDISRWLTEPCKCGSILKRLDKVGDRNMKKGAFAAR